MPKIKTNDQIRADKIKTLLQGCAKGHQDELAEVWGISQPAVSQRLRTGNITLYDLYRAQGILNLDARDIEYLIGR